MIVRALIAFVLALPACMLTARFNMHMFQLNGYKNGVQFKWLGKNIRKQWVLIMGVVVGLVHLLCAGLALDILIYLILWLILLVFRAMKRIYHKKKFVYTARVKRMLCTDTILTLVILLLTAMAAGVKSLPGIFLILVSVQPVMVVFSNVVNHPLEKGINQYYIHDAKKKLRSVPGLTVIGVTGSYGKTSVKFYLQTLLQEKYSVLVTPESYNTPMGVVRTIRESLKPTHEIFVCEMGARHIGDIKELCDIVHPRHGVITSIGPQHLETFFTMENIQNTKFELADALPQDGLLFLNGDNAYIQEKAAAYRNKVFYYNESSGEGYDTRDVVVSSQGTEFTVVSPDGETEHFQTHLIGAHNIINVVGAIAVAHSLGIALKDLKIPVRRLKPAEHRLKLRRQGMVTIIDDAYNSNPIGSKAAVETLAMFDGVRIMITPGMVELGEKEAEYNHRFGQYAAPCCDYVLLVGEKHTKPIYEGLLEGGFSMEKCQVFEKLEDALSFAWGIKDRGQKYILLENDLPDNY